ncbi:tetratricopeptide repeat protein [Fulvivirga marina]|uniref:tetratricopeptide repeat protein n=1 Tax=Fulvivirga marina TaxID=2494733 RepID=UPI00293D9CA5|nr:tetratricopeptide repeat protein [Fulvivirga marina]
MKELAEEVSNNEYLAKYYAHYGLLKREEGIYGEAVNAYQEAYDLYEKNRDPGRQALMLKNIGHVYRMSKMYVQALKYFEDAERLNLKINSSDQLPRIYENIALTYMDKGDYHLAEQYLQKGLKSARDYNQEKVSVLLNLYGKLYFMQGEYDMAREYYNQTLALNITDTERSYLYGNMGETYLKEGNIKEAELWLTNAMQEKKKLSNSDLRPNFNYLAELEILKGNIQEALNHYHQVVQISSEGLQSSELDVAITSLDNLYTEHEQLIISDIERYKQFRSVFASKSKHNKEQREEMETLYHQASLGAVESDAQHKQATLQFKKETFTFQLSTLLTTFLMVLSFLLIVYIINKHRKDKRALGRYESGLQVMMDEYGAKNVVELQKILSRMAE